MELRLRCGRPKEATAMAWRDLVPAEPVGPLHIDCGTCVMQHSEVCDDCVVTFLCEREPDEAVVVDVNEVRALRMLHATGLAPELRHQSTG
jgi:hypothetical protein